MAENSFYFRSRRIYNTNMNLHMLGDEAASFTKEEMQQGKHTEYEKHLHEEMLLNQSTTASDSSSIHNVDNRMSQQTLQLAAEKQASQNGPSTIKDINSISPTTVGGIGIGTPLDSGGSQSDVTGALGSNSGGIGNGSDFLHLNNSGKSGLTVNTDVMVMDNNKLHSQHHHHHSSNSRDQPPKGTVSGAMHKTNTNSHCNAMVNSRTPSPKGTNRNGHIDRVGGAVSTSTSLSSTSCGSVGSTTSSGSSGSSNTSIGSSGGSALGLWPNLDRGNSSARKWNDSPDSLR